MIKIINVNRITVMILLTAFSNVNAQVKISNSSGTSNTESVLHLESIANDKGFLLSRIALQATNLSNPLSAHTTGIVVYNTATAGTSPNNVTPGLYYNDGAKWIKLTTKSPHIGDIKNSFQSGDHNGWYLMNGRAVTSLTTNPRASATALGYSTNLPDASDRYMKNTSGSDAMSSVAGSDNFSLTQANLPNVNFIGTTNVSGSHTHTYADNLTTAHNLASGSSNPLANNANVNATTGSAGAHTHTLSFSLGGTSQAISLKPDNIITNVFIYLGN